MSKKEDIPKKKQETSEIKTDPKLEKKIECSEKPPKDTMDFEMQR